MTMSFLILTLFFAAPAWLHAQDEVRDLIVKVHASRSCSFLVLVFEHGSQFGPELTAEGRTRATMDTFDSSGKRTCDK